MIKKDYILTDHAKERMKERGISIKEVEEALKNHTISYPGRMGETNIVKTFRRGKKIRVVFTTERRKKIIKTVIVMSQ